MFAFRQECTGYYKGLTAYLSSITLDNSYIKILIMLFIDLQINKVTLRNVLMNEGAKAAQ